MVIDKELIKRSLIDDVNNNCQQRSDSTENLSFISLFVTDKFVILIKIKVSI